MQRIFQDWHQWLKDGWLDLGIPMNYATETDDRVRGWFDGWLRWEKHHQHGRQIAIGLGAYRNTAEHTLAQLSRARQDDGARVVGVSFFSYAVPVRPETVKAGTDLPAVPVRGRDRFAFLADGAANAPPLFARPASVPAMPWISAPDRGWIAGTVGPDARGGADGAIVTVNRRSYWPFGNKVRVLTDGTGYFGLGKVKPGVYEISVATARGRGRLEVRVQPGKVTRVALP